VAATAASPTGRPLPSFCSRFHAAVELIGRRWTGAIVQTLMQGRVRYAVLRQTIPDISDRMLSARLKELEQEGLVRRIVTPDTPVRVEYELTGKGRALHDALHAISAWAEQWIPAPVTAGAGATARRTPRRAKR
jgi:DNA-binding HxlR family transcriptional regulator